MSQESKQSKVLSTVQTAIIVLASAVIIYYTKVVVNTSTPIAIMCAAFTNMFFLAIWGVRWEDTMKHVMTIAKNLYGAMLLLLFVGMLVGAWIINGTIPTMIYYGLKIISPAAFLVVATLLCSLMSVMTGTSWGSLSTIGVALMGVAVGLGIPAPYAAGAVIVGSFFGDHISPISDSTILAAAMADVDVLDHVKYMMFTSIPSFLISLVFFFFLGRGHSSGTISSESLNLILGTLEANFSLNIILILIPIIVLFLVYKKIPVYPVFSIGIVAGIATAVIIQGASMGDILGSLMKGYTTSTGVDVVDTMLLRGGIMGTIDVVILMMAATLYGGSFQAAGGVELIERMIGKVVTGAKSLVVFSYMFHTALVAALVSDYTTFSLTSPMLKPLYDKHGLDRVNLSRMYEDTGTTFSLFIPWTSASMFAVATTGVPLKEWMLYTPTVYLQIIFSMIFIFTGFTIARSKNNVEKDNI